MRFYISYKDILLHARNVITITSLMETKTILVVTPRFGITKTLRFVYKTHPSLTVTRMNQRTYALFLLHIRSYIPNSEHTLLLFLDFK